MNFSDLETSLSKTEFQAVGRITTASNGALLLKSQDSKDQIRAIFKPKIGIRQLWDFPKDDLIERELASYLLSKASGFNFIPASVMREIHPFGEGMVQYWIEAAEVSAVKIFSPKKIESGYREVLQANDAAGQLVAVATLESEWIDALTVFDAVINNADRKGSHILTDQNNQLWAIDHGVTWHAESKLRTILWAQAGENFNENQLAILEKFEQALNQEYLNLTKLVAEEEVVAALHRLVLLKKTGAFPRPSQDWPVIPWPIF